MSSNSSNKDDSPLKPIPFDELFRMLNFRNQQAKEPNYSEVENEESDFASNNDTQKHRNLYTIKENVNGFANDSGYSSSNRTNYTSRLSPANTAEVSNSSHEMPSRFLTPVSRPRPSAIYSAKFPSFVAKSDISLSNNEKVLFQYTPSAKLDYSKQKVARKPLFIPPVYTGARNLIKSADFFNGSCEIITVKECKYIKGDLIGRGGSCEVYHVFDPVQKASRAIKIVNLKQNEATATLYRNEVQLLQSLQQSGRVVTLYDYEVDDSSGFLYMVLEKGGKDLDAILKQLSANNCNLPFYKILYYWMEILYCVRDIHHIGIVHSDLKPANFLMAESGIKLIDFGIASHLQTDMTSIVRNSAVGSLNYISPEALKCDNVTSKYRVKFKSDIWSLGCILYQLVYKKAPFQHLTNMWTKIEAITNRDCQIEYVAADWIPQRVLKTIKKCLQLDPNLRPNIHELIEEYEHLKFT